MGLKSVAASVDRSAGHRDACGRRGPHIAARTATEDVPLVWTEPPAIVTLALPVAIPLVNAYRPALTKRLPVFLTCPSFSVICTLPLPDELVAVTTVPALELMEPPPIVTLPSPLRGLLIVMAARPTR